MTASLSTLPDASPAALRFISSFLFSIPFHSIPAAAAAAGALLLMQTLAFEMPSADENQEDDDDRRSIDLLPFSKFSFSSFSSFFFALL